MLTLFHGRKKAALSVLIALVAAWPCGAAYGNTLHVGTDGRAGAAGTEPDPFDSIQEAVIHARPGDTVLVKKGVYRECISFPYSGTPDNPITLLGEEGAVIDGSSDVTLDWALKTDGSWAGQGVYTARVPFDADVVVVDDQTIISLWWGHAPGVGCQPQAPPFDQDLFPYHYERLFKHGMANLPGLSDYLIWAGEPEGWDGVRGLALYRPDEERLWLKLKPGNDADPVDPSTCDVKVAPFDRTVVTIDGADHIVVSGFHIKNGLFAFKVWNSVGSIIENCVMKPVYNGIRLGEGADGIIIRHNEYSMNHYADTSTRSRAANIWHINKDLLTPRGEGDKTFLWILNTVGNHHIHHNYIHDSASGICSGWHGTPEEEAGYNAHTEVDHNLIVNGYQDALCAGKNCTGFKWHHNVMINNLQHMRFFGVWYGPLYLYNNVFISGPMTTGGLVHFASSQGHTPHVYFYHNTVTDNVRWRFCDSSFYANNLFDPAKTGNPNFHYYNNIFYGDRYFRRMNTTTDANWDGNFNTYVQRTEWIEDYGQTYAKAQGIDPDSVWSTESPGFTDLDAHDVSLTADSPAREAGIDLYEHFGFELPGGYSQGYYSGSAPDAGALPYSTPMPRLARTLPDKPATSSGSGVRTKEAPKTPMLLNLTPRYGRTTGGTPVVLEGLGLHKAKVLFDDVPASDVVINENGTRVTCLTPPYPAMRAVSVTATTAAGTSNALTFNCLTPIPILSSIEPARGTAAGGTPVSLTGKFLAGATVTFGGVEAADARVNEDGTQVTCTTPPHAAGEVQVRGTAARKTSYAFAFTFVDGDG